MVDANEDGHAAHHAGPLPLELVRLSKVTVDAGVQQADHSCRERTRRQGLSTRDCYVGIINAIFKPFPFLDLPAIRYLK